MQPEISVNAPIALFCYKRPDHLRQVIESLQNNPESHTSSLIIFCDGPKSSLDENEVQSVRDFVLRISGFLTIEIVNREKNLGLADSVIAGVADVVSRYGKVIVLEDDTVVSPYFLRYMNDALTYYHDDSRVISIHGYLPPLAVKSRDCFFLKGADCWGWATWERGWREFRGNGQHLLDELVSRNLVYAFDLDGAYPYTAMLEEWTQGRNDSWAIRWHASAFLKGLLTLYPSHSLVANIGNDGSGTHSADSSRYKTTLGHSVVSFRGIPIRQSDKMRSALKTFYSASKAPENGVKYLLWKIGIKKNKKKKKPWKERYGWFRTALPWSKAVNRCGGYDSDLILEKCRQSLLQVKQGNAVYERDSVLFDHIEYSWPVLAGLMTAAAHAGGRLHVLDIGGSLGSTYFQNGRFLKCLKDVVWHIVEQPQFVACGKADFTNEQLKFHEKIDDIIAFNNINVILVSSMLQYVENPYDLLSDIVKKQVPFLIFDRTTFSSYAEDFLAIQKVNPLIYSASYPCWFLDRGKFFHSVQNDYELVEQFYSLNHPIKLQDGKKVIECPEEGFIFMRKEISHG